MEDTKRKDETGLTPLQVIGIFWMALGVIMVIAVYAPETTLGKLTNGMAGVIFLAIGWLALWKGKRKSVSDPVDDDACS